MSATPSSSPVPPLGLVWDAIPNNPSAVSQPTISFNVTDLDAVMYANLTVDGVALPVVNDTAVLPLLAPGPHVMTLAVEDVSGHISNITHMWTVIPNFIEAVPVVGAPVWSGTSLFVSVDETPSSVRLALRLPIPPAVNETVTITCVSTDSTVAVTALSPSFFTRASGNTTALLTVTGVKNYVNAEADKPFGVQCSVQSGALPGTTVSVPAYAGASVRGILGLCKNIVWPLFQDVLVRNGFGNWTSSLSPAGSFALTVSQNVTAILVGDVSFRTTAGPHFLPGVRVTVGGWDATVIALLPDVRQSLAETRAAWYVGHPHPDPIDGVLVVFPTYNHSCWNGVADTCVGAAAYKAIRVMNIDGGVVGCPQQCPGYSDTAAGEPGGAYYTYQCTGYAQGSVCLEAATARQCAYGAGDACAPCPMGALCPGGFRAWAQPGYVSQSPLAASLSQCAFPALQRCAGWNVSLGGSVCGAGYAGVPSACSACAGGYYPDLNQCNKCPPSRSQKYTVVGMVVGGVFVAYVCVVLVVGAVFKATTGQWRIGSALFRGRDFVAWVMLTWQTIVQVGKRTGVAPPLIRRIYSALTVMELDSSVALHPDCYSHYPFTLQAMEFTGALTLICVLLFLFQIKAGESKLRRAIPTLRRICMTLLVLLYPLICNASFNMLYCYTNSSGSLVLQYNPLFTCYSGAHIPIAVPAWIAVVCHVFAFPLLSFLHIRRRINKVTRTSSEWQASWQLFVVQDYHPGFFWFVHLSLLTLLTLSLLLVFLPTTPHTPLSMEALVCGVTLILVAVNMTCLLKLKPFLPRRVWKLPVKLLALAVTGVSSAANFVCVLYSKGYVNMVAADNASFVALAAMAILVVVFVTQFGTSVRNDILATQKASPTASDEVRTNNPLRPRPKTLRVNTSAEVKNIAPDNEVVTMINPMATRALSGQCVAPPFPCVLCVCV